MKLIMLHITRECNTKCRLVVLYGHERVGGWGWVGVHVLVHEKIVQHASASSCEFIVGPNAFAVLMKNARVLGESALPLITDDMINRKQKKEENEL